MILFSSDWKRYPTAIADFNTKNRTFVRLASIYKMMGIKNHAFLLALINPELQGVDPFDPNLTIEQQGWIAIECKINPWYYFREVARAPAIVGSEVVPVEANRGNIALWWSFFNHILILLIQIRQTGKSFSTDTLMVLLSNILCENTQINLLTKDDTLRRANIQRIKDIMAELPYYLQQKNKTDVNNGEEITINSLGNIYKTHVPQSSKKAALKVGRGLTSPIFHADEPPFQPNIEIALPAALAAGGAANDRARALGEPYGTILTTTAGKRDDPDGKFIYNLMNNMAQWTERFFDAADAEELEQMVRKSSRDGNYRVAAVFNHRMLGKTDEWLKQKLEDSLQSGEDADRDFFNVWTAGNQLSPLPVDLIEAMHKSYQEPQHFDIASPYGYVTRWYVDEAKIDTFMKEGKFVAGMDTSDASGGDDISLYLLNIRTLETVTVGTFNETNIITFVEWFCSFLVKYENVTAIIERRSTGSTVLDYLLLMLPAHGVDPFKRLFNWVVNDFDEEKDRYAEINRSMGRRNQNVYVAYKKYFGFATSGTGATSRSELYSTTLQLAAKRSAKKIKDRATIDQIAGLVTRNGRVDHPVGEHDDLVIGWLLTHWLITKAKNLAFYGIDVKDIMSEVVVHQNLNQNERWNLQEQRWIRQRMTELYEQLSEERDEFVSMRLEQELRMLDKRIILNTEEVYSLDELIRQAKETKRRHRANSRYSI